MTALKFFVIIIIFFLSNKDLTLLYWKSKWWIIESISSFPNDELLYKIKVFFFFFVFVDNW